MKCPYRINQTVTEKYKDFQGNGMYRNVESEFADCYMRDCPYFMTINGNNVCGKVRAEVENNHGKA